MRRAHHVRAHDAHQDSHHPGRGGHSHGRVDASLLESQEAIRTLWRSLIILAVTAALQIVVVVASGSVALLSDTVHNLGDALTAVPLVAAFLLGRRAPTARLTYGWGRAEDLAGLAVLAIILFSAVYAGYEAIARLIHPSTPGYLLAVGLAGAIGFAGNEWVAVYRLRTGRRIASAALVADGYHARIDGFTSLAVVAGAIGVALGFRLADPIVGLAIAVVILRIVWMSAKEIGLRVLDGIEPEIIKTIRHEAGHAPGVRGVAEVRARWFGHEIHADVLVVTRGDATLEHAHRIARAVSDRLRERVDHLGEAIVRVEPESTIGAMMSGTGGGSSDGRAVS